MSDSPEVVIHAGLLEELENLWRDGLPPGDRTGWPSVDKHYSVVPGQLTILTGWPGSGKSEWLDALLVHLMHQDWRIAIFSPENQPLVLHAAKLLEKVSGKPFGRGPTERMTLEDIRELSIEMLAGRLAFVKPPDDGARTAQNVIDAAKPWLDNFKGEKRGLVIDPWNELEHWRPQGLSETEYISQQLSLVRNWARQHSVHVWIVAHPQKVRREDGKLPVPRPDMIAGSQHWWNKADCAITVWRDMENPEDQNVDIHVQKVRFKHVGRPGVVTLRYDRVTGRYHELPNLRDVTPQRGNGWD
jgi:twinkle protein